MVCLKTGKGKLIFLSFMAGFGKEGSGLHDSLWGRGNSNF
jgi:hypothetical protein